MGIVATTLLEYYHGAIGNCVGYNILHSTLLRIIACCFLMNDLYVNVNTGNISED